MTAFGEMRRARRRLIAARDSVQTWLTDEGKRGELKQANQAPAWPEYELARREWEAALVRFDSWLAANREA